MGVTNKARTNCARDLVAMNAPCRGLAGILLVVLPTVIIGGVRVGLIRGTSQNEKENP
jgi:hypothetical protein